VKHLCPPWTYIIGCTSLYYGHEWKLQIIGNFEVHSNKNCSIAPKIKLDLHILRINLYTKFHFNMCNQCKENERKLQIIGIFRSPRGITVENCTILTKTELDLDILRINLYTKFHFNMCNQCKENEQKLQIIEIFLSPRGITHKKMNGN
jgi:hypothetical protein